MYERYYWTHLDFDDFGNIIGRSTLWCATRANVVQRLAIQAIGYFDYLTKTAITYRIKGERFSYGIEHGGKEYLTRSQAEAAVRSLEKQQNITGNDAERVVLRYVWNGDITVPEYGYFLKEYQLVYAQGNYESVVDVRDFHEDIITLLMKSGRPMTEASPRRYKPEMGRGHRKSGNTHWQSGIKGTLRNISEHKVRAKHASKYVGSYTYDPKFSNTENNWKQTKCRHQYEWHKKRHKDTMKRRPDKYAQGFEDNTIEECFYQELDF